jgi:hypothetical protein
MFRTSALLATTCGLALMACQAPAAAPFAAAPSVVAPPVTSHLGIPPADPAASPVELAMVAAPEQSATDATRSFLVPEPVSTLDAPSRQLFGLQPGTTSAPDVEAWLAQHQLQCSSGPDPRRTTHRYTCHQGLAPALFGEVRAAGVPWELLIVRGDETPVTHISFERRFSIPEQAAEAYSTTLEALQTQFGEPVRSRAVVDASALLRPFARYTTSWEFRDLDVDLVLMRGSGEHISLRETWEVPAATNHQQVRPGSVGMHGDIPEPARNPHLAP